MRDTPERRGPTQKRRRGEYTRPKARLLVVSITMVYEFVGCGQKRMVMCKLVSSPARFCVGLVTSGARAVSTVPVATPASMAAGNERPHLARDMARINTQQHWYPSCDGVEGSRPYSAASCWCFVRYVPYTCRSEFVSVKVWRKFCHQHSPATRRAFSCAVRAPAMQNRLPAAQLATKLPSPAKLHQWNACNLNDLSTIYSLIAEQGEPSNRLSLCQTVFHANPLNCKRFSTVHA